MRDESKCDAVRPTLCPSGIEVYRNSGHWTRQRRERAESTLSSFDENPVIHRANAGVVSTSLHRDPGNGVTNIVGNLCERMSFINSMVVDTQNCNVEILDSEPRNGLQLLYKQAKCIQNNVLRKLSDSHHDYGRLCSQGLQRVPNASWLLRVMASQPITYQPRGGPWNSSSCSELSCARRLL